MSAAMGGVVGAGGVIHRPKVGAGEVGWARGGGVEAGGPARTGALAGAGRGAGCARLLWRERRLEQDPQPWADDV